MTPRLDDSQIVTAYISFRDEFGASADSILVNPSLREGFLERHRKEVDEEPILRRLLNLRKRSRLPCRE
jgi:hypothetical protein